MITPRMASQIQIEMDNETAIQVGCELALMDVCRRQFSREEVPHPK